MAAAVDHTAGTASRARRPTAPLLVLVVLVGVAVAAFAESRQVVADQEHRLLTERASEVRALLSNSVGSVESSLRVLGPIGASPDPGASSLFAESAGRLVEGDVKTAGVATEQAGGMTVTAAVGDGPAAGTPLGGERGALARRALDVGQLVSDLVSDKGAVRVVLARPVGGQRAVAYLESAVDPSRPVPAESASPFRNLRVALYASAAVDPGRLVLTTEADVPLAGRVERVPFPVGADRWLLVVAAREPLAGNLSHNIPWLFLGGGIVTAVLSAAIIEALTRRRAYALSLVAERTGELGTALRELGDAKAVVDRLMSALPVVVGRLSLEDGRHTYLSPNTERVLGVTETEALTPGFMASRIHPDDMADAQATLARVVSERTPQSSEHRFTRGDGTAMWLSTVQVPELDDQGNVTAIFAYAWDVTDRHIAEDARRDAQAAAEDANQAKSAFLSRMSHELRTPLNAVLGFAQLLEIDDITDPQREAVGHILKSGRHLLELINEVLDISRIEAGELSLSPEPVHVAELVAETVDLIRPLAGQRGIQLVVDRSSGGCDCYMFADRQRTKQVLLNLLSNAIKYNRPRGSVAVSCEQPLPTQVRINVADTGVGVPAERLGLLFAPFERLGAEHTGEEGTGVGLALSRRLAEAMGGTLTVASTLGEGSTFTVELPRVEGPVERYERLNAATEPAAEPAAERRVVLHIEDNLSNLTLIERVLAQRPGVEVLAAMQGRLGLELAREHRPVLVLLDLHLPDIGGEQVLQRLRDDPVTASIPVVIVSADATPGQARRLLAAGAAAYLTKPLDVRALLRLLDETVTPP